MLIVKLEALTEPADVYCMWIDECAKINKMKAESDARNEYLDVEDKNENLSEFEAIESDKSSYKEYKKNKIRKLKDY